MVLLSGIVGGIAWCIVLLGNAWYCITLNCIIWHCGRRGGFLTPTLSPFYTGRASFDSIKSQIFHARLSQINIGVQHKGETLQVIIYRFDS